MNAPLRWYLSSTAAFLIPGGIQMVLFPWLVAVMLHEPAQRVGIAQMAGALPALFLILFGGVVGDRFDQRRTLIGLHLFGALPPLVLALLIGNGLLSYGLLIGYALVGGIVGAFSQPARDALLSRVAGDRIQRTVTIVMGMQFGVQILGISLASLADRLGAVPLILTQATIMACGAFAVSRIRVERFEQPLVRKHVLKEIREGLALVFGSERLLPIMLLTFAIGVFFAGAFTVLIPLTIRDIYHGGAQQIGFAYVLNMVGTVAVTLLLLARGGVARPGRAVILAQGCGSLLFVPIVFGVPIAVVLRADLPLGRRRRSRDEHGAQHRAGSGTDVASRARHVRVFPRNDGRHADRLVRDGLRDQCVRCVERRAGAGDRYGRGRHSGRCEEQPVDAGAASGSGAGMIGRNQSTGECDGRSTQLLDLGLRARRAE